MDPDLVRQAARLGIDLGQDEPSLIRERLRVEGIEALYHVTSIKNIPGIAQLQALCSKGYLEGLGRWPCPFPGGSATSHQLDRRHGNWDRLSLALVPYVPMLHWQKKQGHEFCIFEVDAAVAGVRGVTFTDRNAVATNQRRERGILGLDLIDFKALRSKPTPHPREAWIIPIQAEVLVPNPIRMDQVRRVIFRDDRAVFAAKEAWGSAPGRPQFTVNPSVFEDLW